MRFVCVFLPSYVEERPWWPYKASTKEERKKRKAKRRERSEVVLISVRVSIFHPSYFSFKFKVLNLRPVP